MKVHLEQTEIRAYLDGELGQDRILAIAEHLILCAECRKLVDEEAARMARVGALLSNLEPVRPASVRLSVPAARRRLEDRLVDREMEAIPMIKRILSGQYRSALIAVSMITVLGVSLAFPQVRAFATGLLSTFRVQQVTVLPVDTDAMASKMENLNQYEANFEQLLEQNAKLEESGDTQEVANAADATDAAGFTVRLPAGDITRSNLSVQPVMTFTYTLDVNQTNQIFSELGMEDLLLSENLDGSQIQADFPAIVTTNLGDCPEVDQTAADPDQTGEIADLSSSNCITFLQMPSPVVTAPDGLDVAKYVKSFLVLSGMDETEAEEFTQRVDWATTLVIPIPVSQATYQNITVDGVDGTLIESSGESDSSQYVLIWVKEGIVYVLSGNGDSNPALDLANTLE